MRLVWAVVLASAASAFADDDAGLEPGPDKTRYEPTRPVSLGIDDPLWRKNNWQLGVAGGYFAGRERLDDRSRGDTAPLGRVGLHFYLLGEALIGADLTIDRGTATATAFIAPMIELSRRSFLRVDLGFGADFGEHTAARVRIGAALVLYLSKRVSVHAGPEGAIAVGYLDDAGMRSSYVVFTGGALAGLGYVFGSR